MLLRNTKLWKNMLLMVYSLEMTKILGFYICIRARVLELLESYHSWVISC